MWKGEGEYKMKLWRKKPGIERKSGEDFMLRQAISWGHLAKIT